MYRHSCCLVHHEDRQCKRRRTHLILHPGFGKISTSLLVGQIWKLTRQTTGASQIKALSIPPATHGSRSRDSGSGFNLGTDDITVCSNGFAEDIPMNSDEEVPLKRLLVPLRYVNLLQLSIILYDTIQQDPPVTKKGLRAVLMNA